MTAPGDAAAPRRLLLEDAATPRLLRLRWAAFPVLVLLVFGVLVALNLSGSSLSLLVSPGERTGLIAGEPRPIRADEYRLRTPLAVSQAEQGFPAQPWVGLARLDSAASAHGGPTREWSTLFKPQDWGYLLLGPSHGLAFGWWWSFAASLWGCYALFGVLTRSPALAALLAIPMTFSPYTAWWTAPAPALFVGYAAAAGALLWGAWSATRRWVAIGFSLLSAGAGLALALALYPPWQLSLGIVVAATLVGVALDRRVNWRQFTWTTGTALGLAGALLATWAYQHREAIAAIAGTYYPGQRVSAAGTADLAYLLSAPLNFWLAGDAGASLGQVPGAGPWANLAESSSTWLALPVTLLLSVGSFLLLARRIRSDRSAAEPAEGPVWALALTSGAVVLLSCWAFLPLPDWFGQWTLLNRVQPSRIPLALGLASLIQVALATRVGHRPRLWGWPWLAGAALVGGLLAVWVRDRLAWDPSGVPPVLVFAVAVLVGGCLAAATHRRYAIGAAAVLAVLAFTSWAIVNPLQRGIAEVIDTPLVRELRSLPGDNPRTLVFGDLATVALVRMAGLQSLGGTTIYPDAELMQQLAPHQEQLWNNYANYQLEVAPSGAPTVIEQVRGTRMKVALDPCQPELLAQADPGWVVTEAPVDAACLTLEKAAVATPSGTRVWIYQVSNK